MRYSRINMSRAELLTELTGILAESADPRSRNDRHLGEVIWQLVDRLRFCGAGVYEPRGLSDTGLSDEDMHQISLYHLPPYAQDELFARFDAQLAAMLGSEAQ